MQTAQHTEEKDVAYAKWREYRTALKTHKEQYLTELSDAYYQLSRGRKVLDLEESFKLAGLNAEGLPSLGFARADQRLVSLYCGYSGDCAMRRPLDRWHHSVVLEMRAGLLTSEWGNKHRGKSYSAPVPLIPPQHIPKGSLENYHILWEVETWTLEPPHDPILLKKISANLFAVMAQWDLSELERSVMRSSFTPRPAR